MSDVPLSPTVLISNRQPDPIDEPGLIELARRVLEGEGRTDAELSVSFVSPREMSELHERYTGEEGPTDVLSFAQEEDGLLGDVVIAPAVAQSHNPDVDSELRLLLVHGILHLLGYDHEKEAQRARMWARQERYTGVRVK